MFIYPVARSSKVTESEATKGAEEGDAEFVPNVMVRLRHMRFLFPLLHSTLANDKFM